MGNAEPIDSRDATTRVETDVGSAYRYCRAIAHKYGANFSVGFRFLPRPKRDAVYAAYAFCRWADDIADEPGLDIASRLDQWQAELDRCYSGRPQHIITVALADALETFPIPRQGFVDLIDGCRLDLVKTRYGTFDELLHYCDLVATSISSISLPIFGYRTGQAIEHGRYLATALQLTNVTRDIGDDLDRDRIYLPAEDLERFGVTERELASRQKNDRVRGLIEFQIERAEGYFSRAEPLLAELSSDARFPTQLMGAVYVAVLKKLKRDPFRAIGPRLSLSRAKKVATVIRAIPRRGFF
jgi:phytoene synthase